MTIPTSTKKQIAEVNFIQSGVLYDTKVNDPSIPSIPQFFAGRDIFITGGSGFMGRVLIEQLLRSCPDISQLYILMREKKGKSILERIEDLKNLPLFSVLKNSNPKVLDKMVPIPGDVTLINLGLSDENWQRMQNVSVIFHAAASVRFDDDLKYAIILNTRGTREVIRFAETLADLKVMMHVSTTYCNIKTKEVKEEIYPPMCDWKTAIKIAESLDPFTLDILGPQYMDFMPNTYTFTKHLSEQIVNDYKDKLPLVVFRPSIVISTMKDPFPGWVDNFNGPIGLLIGCGVGLTRTLYSDPKNIIDYTPVDVCIKAMIVGAWKKALEGNDHKLPVYNASMSSIQQLSVDDIARISRVLITEIPIEKFFWPPSCSVTTCRFYNFLRLIFLQLIPAICLDFVLKLMGKKPFVLRLQRKAFNAVCALEYFLFNNWHFRSENFLSLDNAIKEEDARAFHYLYFIEFDQVLYLKNCLKGGKLHLLGEKEETLPQAHKNLAKMKRINFCICAIFYCILIYIVLVKFDLLGNSWKILNSILGYFKFW